MGESCNMAAELISHEQCPLDDPRSLNLPIDNKEEIGVVEDEGKICTDEDTTVLSVEESNTKELDANAVAENSPSKSSSSEISSLSVEDEEVNEVKVNDLMEQ